MDKKRKKLKHIENGVILGFDEINNSFNLRVFNPYHEPSVIVVGYMMPDTGRANYGSQMFERKGNGIFTNGRLGLTIALRRGREYISRNHDFLFTKFTKSEVERTPLCLLKGNAIAALTFAFFLRYNLNPLKTQIVYDSIDRRVHTAHLESVLEMWFEKANLQVYHVPKTHADDNVTAVRKADRVAYYLAAIAFLGDNSKWPYRHRKIELKKLDELAIRIADRNQRSYPEL